MTGRKIAVQGSDEVMAVFGEPETFYRGKWQNIEVTEVGEDEDTPLSVRKSLVGLTIPTIFSKEQIESETGTIFPIPNGSRLSYVADVMTALNCAGRFTETEQLREIAPTSLDMYVFEREIYELVD